MLDDNNFDRNFRDWDLFERRTKAEIFEDELEDHLRKRECDAVIERESITTKDPKYPELEAQRRYQFFKIYFTEQYRWKELLERLKRGVRRNQSKGLNRIKKRLRGLLLEVIPCEERRIELYEQLMSYITSQVMELEGLKEFNNELEQLLVHFNRKIWTLKVSERVAKGLTRKVLMKLQERLTELEISLDFFFEVLRKSLDRFEEE